MTSTRLNNRGQTFEQWYTATDAAVSAICGLGVDDLPDGNSWEEGFPFA